MIPTYEIQLIGTVEKYTIVADIIAIPEIISKYETFFATDTACSRSMTYQENVSWFTFLLLQKERISVEILPHSKPDMLDPEKKKEMMEGIVTEIMARMKAQGMSQEDILKTIEKISKQGIEDEDWPTKKDFTPWIRALQRKRHFLKPKRIDQILNMINSK